MCEYANSSIFWNNYKVYRITQWTGDPRQMAQRAIGIFAARLSPFPDFIQFRDYIIFYYANGDSSEMPCSVW